MLDDAINWSISVSVGINGSAFSCVYLGRSHALPIYLKKPVKWSATVCFVEFFHLRFAMASFTSYGLVMSHSCESCVKALFARFIVSSAFPFAFMWCT